MSETLTGKQCLALGSQLKVKFKITDYKIYRVYPSGEIQYLHPADGVFPVKVNEGREMVNFVPRNIGSNPNPSTLKFSGKRTIDP